MTYDLSPNQVVKKHPKWIRIKANAPVGICSEVRQTHGWTGERMIVRAQWTKEHTPHKQSKWKTILYRLSENLSTLLK